MITGKQLKAWAAELADDALVGIEDDDLVTRKADSEGWEETFNVGLLPCVDDTDKDDE